MPAPMPLHGAWTPARVASPGQPAQPQQTIECCCVCSCGFRWRFLVDLNTTPERRIHILHGLRERPRMAADVQYPVLTLAIGMRHRPADHVDAAADTVLMVGIDVWD